MSTYQFNPFTNNLDLDGDSTGSGSSGTFKARIVPTPSPNGSATTFTLPGAYQSGTLAVFLNGLFEPHITEASSTTFTTSSAPASGDELYVCYMTQGAVSVTSGFDLEDGTEFVLTEDGSYLLQEA